MKSEKIELLPGENFDEKNPVEPMEAKLKVPETLALRKSKSVLMD
jgi:hypothetical protein